MRYRKTFPPWISACLAGFLLFACDFGSDGGSDGDTDQGPLAGRLWHLPLIPDSGAAWASDTVGLQVAGEDFRLHRLWNGCFHLLDVTKAVDFLRSTDFAAEVVASSRGDSLRISYTRDSLRTFALEESRGACRSDLPLGTVTLRANGFEGGAYGLEDTVHVTLDYGYIPHDGDARDYRLMLDFYRKPGDFRQSGVSRSLVAAQGTVQIAIPAASLPLEWRDGDPMGYVVRLGFARNATREDYMHIDTFRPILATYRP